MDLSGQTLDVALLVKGEFPGGDLRLWTGVGPLTYAGEEYTGAAGVMQIGAAPQATDGSAEGIQISLNGLDAAAVSVALAEPYQRARVTVYLALMGGDPPGVVEAEVFFSGLADQMPIEDDPSNPLIALSVEPRTVDFRRARPVRWTAQDHLRRFPTAGDLNGFHLAGASEARSLPWGKPG